jgi:hypothetical protein
MKTNTQETEFSIFSDIFLGRAARAWPELGGSIASCGACDSSSALERAFCQGLFRSYYARHNTVGVKHLRKICSGSANIPVSLLKFYMQPGGYKTLRKDILSLVQASTSPTRLCTCCHNLHSWVATCNLTAQEKSFLQTQYTLDPYTRQAAADYITAVLYTVLQREAVKRCGSSA